MQAIALSEGEQNRLIIDNTELVSRVASDYRGQKGIPFEELEAEGMLGLVQAARTWVPDAKFTTYATTGIRWAIQNFIARWQKFIPLDVISEEELEDRLHEWQNWGTGRHHDHWE